MTLIVGLNLSDRLILAADTRATHADGSFSDDIIKLMILGEIKDHTTKDIEKGYIFTAVAGDVEFATFVFNNIQNDLSKNNLGMDIRRLYDFFDKKWALKIATLWFEAHSECRSCCFIFGGTYPPRPKVLSKDIVNKVKEIFDNLEHNFDDLLKVSDVENSWEDKSATIPGYFLDESVKREGLNHNLPDSLIFSIEIILKATSEPEFNKNKAEWGEFIVRGKNTSERDLPIAILARCETFSEYKDQGCTRILTKVINNISTSVVEIGGPVLSIAIKKGRFDSYNDINNSDLREGKPFFKQQDGSWAEAKYFNVYQANSKLSNM